MLSLSSSSSHEVAPSNSAGARRVSAHLLSVIVFKRFIVFLFGFAITYGANPNVDSLHRKNLHAFFSSFLFSIDETRLNETGTEGHPPDRTVRKNIDSFKVSFCFIDSLKTMIGLRFMLFPLRGSRYMWHYNSI